MVSMRLNENDFEKILNKMQNGNKGKIKACGYCRFSSDRQREESIEAQQRIIKDYADKNGYEIITWYIDRAFSGKTVNRPDFQRLLNDVASRECQFSAVLVHKLDRFSRNASESLKYNALLQDHGISLVSTAERIKDDANGRLLYGIMSNINQYYIDNLSNEVMKGMRENALQKKWNGGTPPLGYDVVNQELVINEAEAVIVRKIFEMAAEGNGYNTIIRELNACGYRTKAGNHFGKNSLYDLLRNERYKGVYIFNKCSKRNSQNKRNSHKYKDESEIIRIEDGNPAIVSKELWNRANVARKMTGRITTNAKHNYLLSGLLYCGECGAKLHGNHRTHGSNGYNTYRCNKQANQLTCSCKEIRADILEDFVIDSLTEHFFNPEVTDIITEQINNKIHEIVNTDSEDIQLAKNSLNGLKVARNNLADAIAKTGFNQTLADKLDSIEKQIVEYEKMIADDDLNKTKIEITKDDVKKKIAELKKCMMNPKNIEQTKIMLQSYIEKIVVDNKSVQVTFMVAFSFCLHEFWHNVHYNHIVEEGRIRLYSDI